MAEDKAAAKAVDTGAATKAEKKPIILYALVAMNMIMIAGVGAMLYTSRMKEKASAQTIDKVAQNLSKSKEDSADEAKGKEEAESYIGQMIPLETFLVNLSGSRGNKLLKVNMELEVEGGKIAEELDKRKPQIRDIIIILLSSKTYTQLESPEGKEFLRDEIRDTVNSFLTKGKIKRVHFTEFIVN